MAGDKRDSRAPLAQSERIRLTAPRLPNVLGARYQVNEVVAYDGLTSFANGVDTVTHEPVHIFAASTSVFSRATDRKLATRAWISRVGVGGKYLCPLLDAGDDRDLIFAIGRGFGGISLRSLFRARFSRGKVFSPREVLPLAAELNAALACVPTGAAHGDVRAERVSFSETQSATYGAFVINGLPRAALSAALKTNDAWRRVCAPEVIESGASTAADRYGVAMIVLEAMTAKVSPTELRALYTTQPEITEALAQLLHENPKARATDLDGLIHALAYAAKLPVPHVTPYPVVAAQTPKQESFFPPYEEGPETADITDDDFEPAENSLNTMPHVALDDDSPGIRPNLSAQSKKNATPAVKEPKKRVLAAAPDPNSTSQIDQSLLANLLTESQTGPLKSAPVAPAKAPAATGERFDTANIPLEQTLIANQQPSLFASFPDIAAAPVPLSVRASPGSAAKLLPASTTATSEDARFRQPPSSTSAFPADVRTVVLDKDRGSRSVMLKRARMIMFAGVVISVLVVGVAVLVAWKRRAEHATLPNAESTAQ